MKRFFKIFFLSVGILLIVAVTHFLVVKKMDNRDLAEGVKADAGHDITAPMLLPSLFINGERFYIKMTTAKGDTLLAFGDTGGGISMVQTSVIDKLDLQAKTHWALVKGIMPMKYIAFSDIVSTGIIPGPQPPAGRIFRTPYVKVAGPFLVVPPEDEEMKFITQSMPFDIFLGQNFFMGRAWTFDYVHRQVWVGTPLAASDEGTPGVQRLGFKKNENQQKIYGHPSMYIEVGSEKIDVLFDAGASIVLSDRGKKAFNTEEKSLGGSFIAASVFDKWRKEHPEWKYYEKADWKQDIIEVPLVKVGGYNVGPVLFAKRPDEAWSQNMIHTMDKVVKGALGGSALKYFKVMIDYNSELIKFER